ncbi:hypothetical protein ACF0H5_000483 [Mactra antiquata]
MTTIKGRKSDCNGSVFLRDQYNITRQPSKEGNRNGTALSSSETNIKLPDTCWTGIHKVAEEEEDPFKLKVN